jgi:hypothetical protein
MTDGPHQEPVPDEELEAAAGGRLRDGTGEGVPASEGVPSLDENDVGVTQC